MAKSFLPPAQLDFNQYKSSLKTFLAGQTQFSDYNFEGSNLSVMLDLLALNAYNQAHYLNMVGSEMFLDSAQLRESIVSHAKELNYTPRSRISSRSNISIQITPPGLPATITIPKYYPFKTTASSSNTIRFITDQPIVIKKDANNQYISDTFTIYEGIVVREVFDVIATTQTNGSTTYNQRFALQSANIDITSIEVSIQQTSGDLYPVNYSRANDLFGLDNLSQIFFVRGYKDNQFEIEFGDGILGAALIAGNVVTVTYRDTIGDQGNGQYVFTKTSAIDGASDVVIRSTTRATGGAERETNDSVKYNAVRHFQVQNRATIASDYQSLIKSNFPEIEQVNAYGGEEIFMYGKVIIVLKPYNLDGVVDNGTKTRVIDFLKTKNFVPEPIIVNPEYYYLGINGTATYDLSATVLRESEITSAITSALLSLNTTNFNDFDVDVHQSLINSTISNASPSIIGSDIWLSMIKRWSPVAGVSTELIFTTDNAIRKSSQGEYINSSSYGISSGIFQMVIDDAIEDVVVRDNGIGELFTYVIAEDLTLVKRLPAIGTIDYDTGKVSLRLDVYQYTGYIKFTCILAGNSIDISRDKFILVDTPEIDIALVKK